MSQLNTRIQTTCASARAAQSCNNKPTGLCFETSIQTPSPREPIPHPTAPNKPGCLLSLPTQLFWVTQTHTLHTQNLSCPSRGAGETTTATDRSPNLKAFKSQSFFPPAFLQHTLIYFIFNIYLNSLTPFWLQIESSYTELWTVVTVGIFWVFPLW